MKRAAKWGLVLGAAVVGLVVAQGIWAQRLTSGARAAPPERPGRSQSPASSDNPAATVARSREVPPEESLEVPVSPIVKVAGEAAAAAAEGVVNLNTASEAELERLPGIGKKTARAIVAHRAKHPFRTIQELTRVKGIGVKSFRKLEPHLTIDGPTTLSAKAEREAK